MTGPTPMEIHIAPRIITEAEAVDRPAPRIVAGFSSDDGRKPTGDFLSRHAWLPPPWRYRQREFSGLVEANPPTWHMSWLGQNRPNSDQPNQVYCWILSKPNQGKGIHSA